MTSSRVIASCSDSSMDDKDRHGSHTQKAGGYFFFLSRGKGLFFFSPPPPSFCLFPSLSGRKNKHTPPTLGGARPFRFLSMDDKDTRELRENIARRNSSDSSMDDKDLDALDFFFHVLYPVQIPLWTIRTLDTQFLLVRWTQSKPNPQY